MATPVVRPATRADIRRFIDRDPPFTCRAWVACLDGEPVGIAGYYMEVPLVFSQMTDALRPHRRFIARVAKDFLSVLPSPILAIAANDEPNSERFLKWLGFEWVETDTAGEVYKWQTR